MDTSDQDELSIFLDEDQIRLRWEKCTAKA